MLEKIHLPYFEYNFEATLLEALSGICLSIAKHIF